MTPAATSFDHTSMTATAATYPVPLEEQTGPLWDSLRGVMDPELPVSLVDLGLVYDVRESASGEVEVDLTFTASGCPCMAFIKMDLEEALLAVDGVSGVTIHEVWNPPWTRSRVSPAGRERMKKFGVGL